MGDCLSAQVTFCVFPLHLPHRWIVECAEISNNEVISVAVTQWVTPPSITQLRPLKETRVRLALCFSWVTAFLFFLFIKCVDWEAFLETSLVIQLNITSWQPSLTPHRHPLYSQVRLWHRLHQLPFKLFRELSQLLKTTRGIFSLFMLLLGDVLRDTEECTRINSVFLWRLSPCYSSHRNHCP